MNVLLNRHRVCVWVGLAQLLLDFRTAPVDCRWHIFDSHELINVLPVEAQSLGCA